VSLEQELKRAEPETEVDLITFESNGNDKTGQWIEDSLLSIANDEFNYFNDSDENIAMNNGGLKYFFCFWSNCPIILGAEELQRAAQDSTPPDYMQILNNYSDQAESMLRKMTEAIQMLELIISGKTWADNGPRIANLNDLKTELGQVVMEMDSGFLSRPEKVFLEEKLSLIRKHGTKGSRR